MATTYNVLILGASYGSLLAVKLLMAGHKAKLVCLPAEVELIRESRHSPGFGRGARRPAPR